MPVFQFTAADVHAIHPPDATGAPDIVITAELDSELQTYRFRAEAKGLRENAVSVWFGPVCITQVSAGMGSSDILVPLADFFALSHITFSIRGFDFTDGAGLRLEGNGPIFSLFELTSERAIVQHIQHLPSRFKEPELLRIAAKHVYHAPDQAFILRALSIVILGYRLIDVTSRTYNALDQKELDWVLAACRTLMPEGERLLTASGTDREWKTFRWTLSVAKMAGYLALSVEDYEGASRFFRFAVDQVALVELVPAAGANVATMMCLHGVLLVYLGDPDGARATWTLCVERMKWIIGQQKLYLSISSYSESIEVVRSTRQAFTLLTVTGGLPETNRPPQVYGRRFDPREIWPGLVWKMINAGRCTKLYNFLIEAELCSLDELSGVAKRRQAAGAKT